MDRQDTNALMLRIDALLLWPVVRVALAVLLVVFTVCRMLLIRPGAGER